MSSAEMIEIKNEEQFRLNLKYYCCIFDIGFRNLESTFLFDSYLSISKCYNVENGENQNGRLVSADKFWTTITNVDFEIIEKVYNVKWDNIMIKNFRRYKENYLPKQLILSILNLYEQKTKLKGVKGEELNYLLSKENVNSVYGNMVENIVRDIIVFSDRWKRESPNIKEEIEKYNNKYNRYTFYPWGVFCTAYARRNLWTGILNFGVDYIYSDTDSIKAKNAIKHKDYIKKYNDTAIKKLESMADFYNIPHEKFRPKTIEGKEKPLGVWDYEGHYKQFETLRAKCYMIENEDGFNITVSGINKKIAMPYMIQKTNNNPFTMFKDGMYIPPEYTGKNIHTYVDNVYDESDNLIKSGERRGTITDCYGVNGTYHELSAVHLSKSDYTLSLTQDYINYIKGLQDYV